MKKTPYPKDFGRNIEKLRQDLELRKGKTFFPQTTPLPEKWKKEKKSDSH